MNAPTTVYTTPAGHRRYIDRIRDARRAYDEVCAGNEAAAEAGDNSVWHDNFAYEENQRQMHALARRLRDMQAMSKRMTIVRPPVDPERVCLGAGVVIEDLDTGERERWVIAGYEDGDPTSRRLSYIAPLAQGLMGAEEGDERVIDTGRGTRRVEVVSIDAAEPGEL